MSVGPWLDEECEATASRFAWPLAVLGAGASDVLVIAAWPHRLFIVLWRRFFGSPPLN